MTALKIDFSGTKAAKFYAAAKAKLEATDVVEPTAPTAPSPADPPVKTDADKVEDAKSA